MCIDGNNADHTSDFVNAQLASLHAIATTCFKHYEDEKVVLANEVGYDFALAHYIRKHSTGVITANLAFAKPRLDFICNHDIFFHLTIRAGSTFQVVTKITTTTQPQQPVTGVVQGPFTLTTDQHAAARNGQPIGFPIPPPPSYEEVMSSETETITVDSVVTIRVPFKSFTLRGESHDIKNGQHDIKTYVLSFEEAQFVSTPITTKYPEGLKTVIVDYLVLLKHAGHHVVYSIPDFDDDRITRLIDFSAVANTTYDHIRHIRGVELGLITKYIQDAWRQTVWIAEGEREEVKTIREKEVQENAKAKAEGRKEEDLTPDDIRLFNRGIVALSEYNRVWSQSSGTLFQAEFGAPSVKVLCAREAIFYINIDSISFFERIAPKSLGPQIGTFRDWKIALIVEVSREDEEGAITLRFDTTKAAKFVQELSSYSGLDLDKDVHLGFLTEIVDFFSFEYLQILTRSNFVLYRFDPRSDPSIKDRDWKVVEGEGSPKDVATHSTMFGFDQILVFSRDFVQYRFNNLHGQEAFKTLLKGFSWAGFKDVEFDAPEVHLLSSQSIVFTVHIKKLTLTGGQARTFENWRLAFQVPIEEQIVSTVHDFAGYLDLTKAHAYEHLHVKVTPINAKSLTRKIVPIFHDAHFLYNQSTFSFGEGSISVSRADIKAIKAVLVHLKTTYLHHLSTSVDSSIHAVPIWSDSTQSPPPYALTSAAFQVYSKRSVNVNNYRLLPLNDEPLIVIVGMTNWRKMPQATLPYSTTWLIRASDQLSYGTLALSSTIFLQQRILPLLSFLNSATTIVPEKVAIDQGLWNVDLTLWREHSTKKDRFASWHPVPSNNSNFEYEWNYSDGWSYRHKGTKSDLTNGEYYYEVATQNRLTIPALFQAGQLDIVMKGESTISFGHRTKAETYESSAVASWTVVLSLITDINTTEGFKVHIEKFNPIVRPIQHDRDFLKSDYSKGNVQPANLLNEVLTVKTTVDGLIRGLEARFKDIWVWGLDTTYFDILSPLFTPQGDALVDLRPVNADHIKATVGSPRAVQTTRRIVRNPRPKSTVGPIPNGVAPIVDPPVVLYDLSASKPPVLAEKLASPPINTPIANGKPAGVVDSSHEPEKAADHADNTPVANGKPAGAADPPTAPLDTPVPA